jgi:hypothetical protein
MSPIRRKLGPYNESVEDTKDLMWFITHRIVCSRWRNETIEVMAWIGAPMPGRPVCAVHAGERERSRAEWTKDSEGQVWFGGSC